MNKWQDSSFFLLDSSGHPVFAQGKTQALQVDPQLEQEFVKVVIRLFLVIVLS